MTNSKWLNLFMLFCLFLIIAVGICAKSDRDIIQQSGVKGGLVVHLGCGDGKITTAPVFDGLIADNGSLFMCMKDGSVMSLGKRE